MKKVPTIVDLTLDYIYTPAVLIFSIFVPNLFLYVLIFAVPYFTIKLLLRRYPDLHANLPAALAKLERFKEAHQWAIYTAAFLFIYFGRMAVRQFL